MSEHSNAFTVSHLSAGSWKSIISSIKSIAQEAYFDIDSYGISIRSMDPSYNSLIDIKWPSSSFLEYKCNLENTRFGLRLDDVWKILKNISTTEPIILSLDRNSNEITILTEKNYLCRYTTSIIQAPHLWSPLPQYEFDTMMIINTSTFSKILGDIEVISDKITLQANTVKRIAMFLGQGSNCDAYIDIADNGSLEGLQQFSVKKNSSCEYDIELLVKIVKILDSEDSVVKIEFSSQKPLKLEFILSGNIDFVMFISPLSKNIS